jgi:tetratricopeptide (TPR) repeat protein
VLTALILSMGLGIGPGCGTERSLASAEKSLKAHELSAAEASYRSVLERDPESVDALYGLGWVYHLTAQPDRARDYFQRCTRIAPEDHRGFKGLGSVAMSQDQLSQGINWLDQALQLAPGNAAVLNSLAVGHLQGRDFEEALSFARKAAAAAPERSEYGLNEAEALFRLKNHAEALAAVDKSLGGQLEEIRFRALLLVLRARILVAMTGGRLDPDRCLETVPPLLAYLEEARRTLERAEALDIDLAEIGAAKRRVHRRRGYITEQCPGDWSRTSD